MIQSILIGIIVASAHGLEFVDYYGIITIKAGDLQQFVCEDLDTEPGTQYFWSIADRNFTGPVTKSADNEVRTMLEFMPILEDDGQYLRCWKDDQFDELQISIYKQDLVSISALPYPARTPLQLYADFSVYPPPTSNLVTWRIEDAEEGSLDLHPGTEDLDLNIIARNIEPLGDNVYRFSLVINKLEYLETRNLSIQVVTKNVPTLVYFQRGIQDESLLTVNLAVPWWMWLCVAALTLVFISIFIVIFLVIRRGSQTETKSNQGHIYIKTNNPDAPV